MAEQPRHVQYLRMELRWDPMPRPCSSSFTGMQDEAQRVSLCDGPKRDRVVSDSVLHGTVLIVNFSVITLPTFDKQAHVVGFDSQVGLVYLF